MKSFLRCVITLCVVCVVGVVSAQESVVWEEPQLRSLGGNRYQFSVSATVPDGWHIYDLRSYVDGPNPTRIEFEASDGVELIGELSSIEQPTIKWDDIFRQDIGFYSGRVTFEQQLRVDSRKVSQLSVEAEWMMCNDSNCMPPSSEEFVIVLENSHGDNSLWMTIIEAMLWGFAALLTPCVFPMVPMTISFFMKGGNNLSKGRLQAAIYGLFIVVLYTLPIAAIIMITYLLGGDAVTADIFNWIATHWLPNILFFVAFMIFAASFFGAFEITLPSSWVNRSDSKADKQSLGGIFFLALTLVLVSFSCTGPIVGSVLIKSTSGEFWQPIITMLAFSVAFALPFVAVAIFPAFMQRLPKSGGWLGSVKIVLGFLEIALGLKFLSVADQTYHWGILGREVYLSIWIVVFAMLGFYLLGKLRFEHEQSVEKIGFGRLICSITVFSFVVYLIPGLWGAPLKPLAGYLPPPVESMSMVTSADGGTERAANGLVRFFDIDQAQAYANEVGKPLLVDLTGHGCVNCREMEQRVWSDKRVSTMLSDDYVIVALYMDDREQLPSSQWVTTASGRVLKTVGRVNSHMALERFGQNAQPYYIVLGRDGKELIPARGYNLNVEEYIDFLERGLAAYHKSKPAVATPFFGAAIE